MTRIREEEEDRWACHLMMMKDKGPKPQYWSAAL